MAIDRSDGRSPRSDHSGTNPRAVTPVQPEPGLTVHPRWAEAARRRQSNGVITRGWPHPHHQPRVAAAQRLLAATLPTHVGDGGSRLLRRVASDGRLMAAPVTNYVHTTTVTRAPATRYGHEHGGPNGCSGSAFSAGHFRGRSSPSRLCVKHQTDPNDQSFNDFSAYQ